MDSSHVTYGSHRLPPAAAAIVARYRAADLPPATPAQTEICMSPLLWSESIGLLADG